MKELKTITTFTFKCDICSAEEYFDSEVSTKYIKIFSSLGPFNGDYKHFDTCENCLFSLI